MSEPELVFRTLVEVIAESDEGRLRSPIEIAEIYQSLIPYRRFRSVLQFDTNQDYEMALLRFLAGEGGYASVDPPEAQEAMAKEAGSINPNPGAFRDYAAARVFLSIRALDSLVETAPPSNPYAPPSAPDDLPDTLEVAMPETIRDQPSVTARSAETRSTGATTFEQATTGESVAFRAGSHCPGCRRALPVQGHFKFCPYCGVSVVPDLCLACGTELQSDWLFCAACGVARQ